MKIAGASSLGALQSTPQGFVESSANVVRERKELAVAIELNGLLGRVKHGVAVLTLVQVRFQDPLQLVVQVAVQIIRDLIDRLLTV
jgi:hypothetical protein